jgi:hypothetical protein
MHPALSHHGRTILDAISQRPKHQITPNPYWIAEVPYLGGIYVLWKPESSKFIPIYIGETSNLWDRLNEMTRLGRHNALWKLTDKNGKRIRNISILNSPEVADLLVSYLTVPVGRKEAEDYLIALWRPRLINKHNKRFQRRSDWHAFQALQLKIL